MEFAVVGDAEAHKATREGGVALIAPRGPRGLDLQRGRDGRALSRRRAGARRSSSTLQASKKLPRRVVVLHADDRAALGVVPTTTADVHARRRSRGCRRGARRRRGSGDAGARRRRVPLVLLRVEPAVVEHAALARRTCARCRRSSLVKLRNVYSFFTIYANIDGFDPTRAPRAPGAADVELDRWILSELRAHRARGRPSAWTRTTCYGATQRLVDVRRRAVELVRAPQPRALLEERPRRRQAERLRDAPPVPRHPGQAHRAVHAVRGRGHVPEPGRAPGPRRRARERAPRGLPRRQTTRPIDAALSAQDRDGARPRVARPAGAQPGQAQGAPAARAAHVVTDAPARARRVGRASSCARSSTRTRSASSPHGRGARSTSSSASSRTSGRSVSAGSGRRRRRSRRRWAHAVGARRRAGRRRSWAARARTFEGVGLRREDVEIEFVAKEGFAAAGDRVGVVVLDTRIDEDAARQGLLQRAREPRAGGAEGARPRVHRPRSGSRSSGGDRVRRVVDAVHGATSPPKCSPSRCPRKARRQRDDTTAGTMSRRRRRSRARVRRPRETLAAASPRAGASSAEPARFLSVIRSRDELRASGMVGDAGGPLADGGVARGEGEAAASGIGGPASRDRAAWGCRRTRAARKGARRRRRSTGGPRARLAASPGRARRDPRQGDARSLRVRDRRRAEATARRPRPSSRARCARSRR